MAEKVNEKVKKAKTELDIMSMNEKEREIYEEIELARWFYKVDMNKAKNEGRIEVKAEGMELGAKKEKIEIVKAMLKINCQ